MSFTPREWVGVPLDVTTALKSTTWHTIVWEESSPVAKKKWSGGLAMSLTRIASWCPATAALRGLTCLKGHAMPMMPNRLERLTGVWKEQVPRTSGLQHRAWDSRDIKVFRWVTFVLHLEETRQGSSCWCHSGGPYNSTQHCWLCYRRQHWPRKWPQGDSQEQQCQ